MKKIAFLLCSGLAVLALAACTNQTNNQNSTTTGDSSVQVPSPITEYSSLSAMVEAADFEMQLPEDLSAFGDATYALYTTDEGKMIEVSYGQTNQLIFRKANQTSNADISGIYTDYPQSETVEVANVQVTLKKENNLVYLATWQRDGATYSIYSEAGLSQDELLQMVEQVR